MPRYIDADALLKDLVENRGFLPALVKHAILNAPTIEAVPLVRGEWILVGTNVYIADVEELLDEVDRLTTELERSSENG